MPRQINHWLLIAARECNLLSTTLSQNILAMSPACMTLRFTSGAKTVYRQKNNSTTEGTEKHRETQRTKSFDFPPCFSVSSVVKALDFSRTCSTETGCKRHDGTGLPALSRMFRAVAGNDRLKPASGRRNATSRLHRPSACQSNL